VEEDIVRSSPFYSTPLPHLESLLKQVVLDLRLQRPLDLEVARMGINSTSDATLEVRADLGEMSEKGSQKSLGEETGEGGERGWDGIEVKGGLRSETSEGGTSLVWIYETSRNG
jgi:hypothetical protein